MEQWRDVVNFEGFYQISNLGNVKSIRPINIAQRTLSDSQVQNIKEMLAEGISGRKVAKIIGTSQTVISRISRGTSYIDSTRILSPALRRDGYLFVTLAVDNKHSHKTIHSMVAAAFIGPRPQGLHINHKDGNKRNNCIGNLEYATNRGNSLHSLYELGKSKKLTFEQAKDIWYAKQSGEKRKDIATKYSISIYMVTAIWQSKSWWHAR